MCDGIKINLQSVVDFLEGRDQSGATRDELVGEAEECLSLLRSRQTSNRQDKGGGSSINREAVVAVPVVESMLRHFRRKEDVEALAKAKEALEILKAWMN